MTKSSLDIKNYTVLYVEDNHDIAEEITFFLSTQVKQVFNAYNGEEGVAEFKKNQPDMIITDIQMPKMDGLDMIKQIRALDTHVPIIITTAFNEPDYLINAIDIQVDGYILKPLNLKILMNRMVKVLEPMVLRKELEDTNSQLVYMNENLDKIVKEKTDELNYLDRHDPVTKLFNFLKLQEDVETESYTHMILLDISNFSIINKQYGKLFASTILEATARMIEGHVNAESRLYKTESDRFVVLMEEENREVLESFCSQIIGFFDTHIIEVEGLGLSINFSIGISKILDRVEPMINAEYALDIAKTIGSRFFYFYDEKNEDVLKAKEQVKWLGITEKMIRNDKIIPYYQPILDLQTNRIIKYEVLARGKYEGQTLSPYRFIGPAEQLGLVGSITRIIINKSFNYFKNKDVDFSINLTQRDLLDDFFISFLTEKLTLYKIEPSRITFEILENITTSEHSKIIIDKIGVIKRMGFKIAIDDFGIENSNFSRILEIDFDYIKIDARFIKDLDKNEKDKTVVRGIVALAKALEIKTVAEFVESDKIFKIVDQFGIDMVQGYFVGKPENKVIKEI